MNQELMTAFSRVFGAPPPKELASPVLNRLSNSESSQHMQQIVDLMSQGMSRKCAEDIIWLRSKPRWTPELEARLKQSHAEGKFVLICDWPQHEDEGYDPLLGAPRT